jgi:hypothetical protein
VQITFTSSDAKEIAVIDRRLSAPAAAACRRRAGR